jgi:hypothetical protein
MIGGEVKNSLSSVKAYQLPPMDVLSASLNTACSLAIGMVVPWTRRSVGRGGEGWDLVPSSFIDLNLRCFKQRVDFGELRCFGKPG